MSGAAKIPDLRGKGSRRALLPVPSHSQSQPNTSRGAGRKLTAQHDEGLQKIRALLLQRAGYRRISTGHMANALQFATHCEMSIIGHTFSPQEQDDFIDRVHESNPNVFLLCVRFALTQRQ
jgi:hypothetical protein